MRRRAGPGAAAAWRSGRWMRPGRRSTTRPPPGCSGSTWAARAGWRTGSTPSTCSYVREGTGHALVAARQWIPREQISDPVRSLQMALPLDLQFATKGELAKAIVAGALADGARADFVCGGRGVRFLHPVAGLPGRAGPSLRAAGPLQLPRHPGPRRHADLRAGRAPALPRRQALGDPVSGQGIQGRAVVRLDLHRSRVAPALPPDPPARPD